jgi:cytochrome P450
MDWSVSRTLGFQRDPLTYLLDGYAKYGPVFTLRIFTVPVVFALGPEANHFVLVSDADKFAWRDGALGDLIPLLGDGLLTTDGRYHRRARQVMVPSFHRDRIALAGETMLDEVNTAVEGLSENQTLDVYSWTRHLALRIAMRALFGFDPDGREGQTAADFETALDYYSQDYFRQALRGPRSPFDRLTKARGRLDILIADEFAARRANPAGAADDLLAMLMAARDGEGDGLSDSEIRDQVMTLLFAGHDTTTSTVTFLFHELSKNPHELAPLLAEQDEVLGDRSVTPADLTGATLPRLEMAIEEILRLYPPAWVGPRRVMESFTLNGLQVPKGAQLSYSSWASHHLPDVWPEPDAFRPDRFSPENKAKIPKGAYVPFGGGSRTCIGMRFGQMEVRAIATAILRKWRLEGKAGYKLNVRQMPTLSPRDGMPMTVKPRGVAPLVAQR